MKTNRKYGKSNNLKGRPGDELGARKAKMNRERVGEVQEPVESYTSRIRAIGNSKGVILNNRVMEAARLSAETDIVIHAAEGIITIMQVKGTGINTDLSTWDKQFKAAIKEGAIPEGDLFEGMENEFDEKEWV